MTLPHIDYTDLVTRTLVGHADDNSFLAIGKFTSDHVEIGHHGWFYEDIVGPPKSYWKWFVLVKSLSTLLEDGMDQAVDYGVDLVMSIDQNNENCGQYGLHSNTNRYPDLGTAYSWDEKFVTGKHRDGVNPWAAYPPHGALHSLYEPTLQWADAPHSLSLWMESYDGAPRGNDLAPTFVRNGVLFQIANIANCDNAWASGDILDGYLEIQRFRINFFNPVVNSISHRSIRIGETPIITLTGLGFNQSDADLNDPARNPLNAVGSVWDSIVDEIDIIGQQGQGTFTISRPLGDFTCDSDNQITITNFPALPFGTYHLRLFKNNVGPGGTAIDIYAYAGDWRADPNGAVTKGARFSLLISDAVPEEKGSMFFSKWGFKKKDGSVIFQRWAPIDIRSTDYFYDGRLISESGLTRSIDDRSGLPNVSDMSVEVAVDLELRQLLAEYFIKNQPVELFFGWAGEPEAWKQDVITMIVDDHDMEGDVLKVTLKDISQKYFRVSIPKYLITLEEYPNAHESAIGQPMPEGIGLCSKTTEPPGAIAAQYINIVTFKYLAARASLRAIPQVYSNGVLQVEGAGNDYTISWEVPGRTYINFNVDQEENKITFNCEGYMFAPWNSVNGYVQNPAYVMAFLFAFMAEVPIGFLDMGAIDVLADTFEDLGEEESGYWIGQTSQALETAVQELNFTYGSKVWPDRQGRFTFAIKDISNYQTNVWIFEQIDALKPSVRKENLREAINFAKGLFGFIPTGSAYSGSLERTNQTGIDDFEAVIEASDSPWKFPWTNSQAIVAGRVADELLKRGYGVKEINVQLAIDWIFALDIFDSFIYQNPFTPTLSGGGEQQRYYYVKSLSYDFVSNTIGVIGIDLQWLLRQCFIIGVCADMAESWLNATDEMKLFGYILPCDNEDVKKICPCGG